MPFRRLPNLGRVCCVAGLGGVLLGSALTGAEATEGASGVGEAARVEVGAKDLKELNDELTQAGVQAAFQILRQNYVRRDELNFERLNRAALAGLLGHLRGGAELVPRAEAAGEAAREPAVLSGLLARGVGWARPRTFAREEVALLEEALGALAKEGAETLLLDLRSGEVRAGAFEVAAGMLQLLVPQGEILFRLKQTRPALASLRPANGEVSGSSPASEVQISSREPVWRGRVVVLVNQETGNVGETVAAVLSARHQAVVVGEKTQGATVRYETLPVDERHALRFASAELLLADGSSLFQKGLKPDLEVRMTAGEIQAAARLMESGRGKELVHEVARERFNEAALVARRNPELDSYLKRSMNEGEPAAAAAAEDPAPVTDPVLQRAVDLVLSHEWLGQAKLEWGAAGAKARGAPEANAVPKAVPVPRMEPLPITGPDEK